ncbi:MAG: NADH-ubiquinone oxidoreductase-F iron-sulfur binding region domain-containing protein [Chromatiales bacterium]|jgi:[NiFe] hydrogenase diaphorase moiety large subunit
MSDPRLAHAVEAGLSQWGESASSLLQILIHIQQTLGHVPGAAVERLSESLGTSQAVIDGVVSFYSFLSHEPLGSYDFRFSDNIIDRMLGSRECADRLMQKLGLEAGKPEPARGGTVDYTSCTGMGDQGPAALVNGMTLTKLTQERIDAIADLVARNVPVDEWPPEYFEVRENLVTGDILLGDWYHPGASMQAVQSIGKATILEQLESSGLRGRGGAGFSTGMKWRFCAEAGGDEKVVVCNADEGEPGTFKDRLLLQAYADRLFEGMALCAAVIGAQTGFLYLRGEYRYLLEPLEAELQKRRDAKLLGKSILGQTGFDFDIQIHLGAGAYICGEESALIESLEGKRGVPRIRPPFPVTHGYLGCPTVVNNVETFIAAAGIAENGPEWLRSRGTEASPGTKLLSISGDCDKPGIYEIPFGMTIAGILDLCQASDTQAVQVAGPAGIMLAPQEFDRKIAHEDVATGGSFMVFDNSRDLVEVARNFMDFFVHESCGFCTPCRVGTTLVNKRLEKIANGHGTTLDLDTIQRMASVMRNTSHCGLGTTASNPAVHLIEHFPTMLHERLRQTSFEPAFDLDAALEEAREITGRDDPAAHLQGGGV